METREELIYGFERALYLMKSIIDLQDKRKNIQAKYKKNISKVEQWNGIKGFGKFIILGFSIWLLFGNYLLYIPLVIYTLILGHFVGFDVIDPLVLVTTPVMCFLIAFGIRKVINKSIDKRNISIEQENIKINEKNAYTGECEEALIQQIKEVQQQYTDEISGWYPCDYCYIEAAEFFLNAVKNSRADSIKEAVNLYEETNHRLRLEENQRQMIQKQNLSNALAIGGLIMQAGTQSAIDRNTAAINNMNRNITSRR